MRSSDGPRVFVSTTGSGIGRGTAAAVQRAGWARKAVLYTLERAAPHVVGDISVLLTDDRTIRRLNNRFRAIDKPTDVLAFPLGEGLVSGEPFGDVVISMQMARRQARAYRARLDDELSRLLVHGTLHLCGHDHHERRQAARMFALTRRLLNELKALPAGGTASRRPPRRKSRTAEKAARPASKRQGTTHA